MKGLIRDLNKHGLSDTKHQLKYSSKAEQSSTAHKRQPNSSRQHHINVEVSAFDTSRKQEKTESVALIELAIDLLERKQREHCVYARHEGNLTQFICMSSKCKDRIGCSHCVLEKYQDMETTKISNVLTDLVQLRDKVFVENGTIEVQVGLKRQEMLHRVDKQIESIKESFMQNLQQLQRKVKDAIEQSFASSRIAVDEMPRYFSRFANQPPPNSYATTESNPAPGPQNIKQIDIIAKFMQKPQKKSTKNLSSIHYYDNTKPLTTSTKWIRSCTLNPQQEEALLDQLCTTNLTYTDEFIRQQRTDTQTFARSLRIFDSYLSQLTASINDTFASFHRSIPHPVSLSRSMRTPDILAPYSTV